MDLLTTFPTSGDADRARALLEGRGLPYTAIEPTEALARVAVTALAMTPETFGELGDWTSAGVTSSGWVEYRPTSEPMPTGPALTFAEDPFGQARVTELLPCVADENKIRVVAGITGELTPVLPYLNAVDTKASLTADGQTLSLMVGHRTVVLYPDRIAAAKPDGIVDAWLLLERLRLWINQTWGRRHEIAPCYETRSKPPALEILKRLPATNCGLCGELTCMALALRVSAGEVPLARCAPLLEPEHAERRKALLEVVARMKSVSP